MVFNTAFNNISAMSVLLVDETGVSGEISPTSRKSLTNFIIWYSIEYTSP
jgi:hypothetical protein